MSSRCSGITQKGNRCLRTCSPGKKYCHDHYDPPGKLSIKDLMLMRDIVELSRNREEIIHACRIDRDFNNFCKSIDAEYLFKDRINKETKYYIPYSMSLIGARKKYPNLLDKNYVTNWYAIYLVLTTPK